MASSTTNTKVALITGGSGGIGLAVAQTLAAQGNWSIHLVDIKQEEGLQAARSLPNTTFHHVDLRNYDALGAAFKAAYMAGGQRRLDFVFANAGLIEKSILYDLPSSSSTGGDGGDGESLEESLDPPPRPDYKIIEINLQGAMDTVHLAHHFMQQQSPTAAKDKGAIVVTASCSSVWPTYWAPLYSASKFGILGYTRSLAGHFKIIDGIRLNTILPGAVRTPILDWGDFPEHTFTPMELIVEVVLNLAAGGAIVDSKGTTVPPEKAYGQALVVAGRKVYIQPEPEYPDETIANTIEATSVENRLKNRG